MKIEPKKLAIITIISFVLGIVWFIGLKLILLTNDKVHYHANFALYINGQRDEFDSGVYYEEIQACTADVNDPKTRVHLHDHVDHVIHVHASGVTWSQFFTNIGYTLGDGLIATRDATYVNGVDGKKLSFILNGQPIGLIADRIIHDTDRLLINYGTESDADLALRYATVEHDAAEVDKKTDPASCGGASDNTLFERLKRAAW